MDASLSVSLSRLQSELSSDAPPLLIDVRRAPVFQSAADYAAGALRRDPALVSEWAGALPGSRNVVVYCVHGHEVSQGAAAALRKSGIQARYLEGGLEAWKAGGAPVMAKPAGCGTRWITRERPKIDRIACPWLIARFIDADAEFVYAPAPQVLEKARELHATSFDAPDAQFSHVGDQCSFDALLGHFRLAHPALSALATIVRAADTGRLDLSPQAAGLLAVSLGMGRNFGDDHVLLRHGMVLYDALYTWCRDIAPLNK